MLYKYQGRLKPQAIGGALVAMGSIGLMRPMIWQMLHERGLRKHPAFGTQIRYTFTVEGMQMSGKAGSADVSWSEFFEVVETTKGLLIYQNKKSYIWIPVCDIASDQASTIIDFWRNSNHSTA